MGIIDTHSEYSLYDVLDGSLGLDENNAPEGTVDYYGIFVTPVGEGPTYRLQYDGHVGELGRFDDGAFEDVLELVDYLNKFLIEIRETDDIIEYAGPRVTSEKEKAETHDGYQYVPEDPRYNDTDE